MFKTHIYTLIGVLLLFSYAASSNGQSCITPDTNRGTCVPMDQCERISRLIRSWPEPYPDHVTSYVRKSHCGTFNNKHYGCCAEHDIKRSMRPTIQSSSIPITPPTPSYQRITVTNPSNYEPSYPTFANNQVPLPSYGERLLNAMPCGQFARDRISNGEVVRLSEFPWMALLEYEGPKSRKRFQCAGALISDRYVLTAAHCVVGGEKQLLSVRLGEQNLDTDLDCERYFKANKNELHCAPAFVDVPIESIMPHTQYDQRYLINDIALLRLVRSVQFDTHIKPICLPLPHQIYHDIPESLIIAGWGVTEQGFASDMLMKATIPLQNGAVCQNVFKRSLQLRPEHVCAGGENRQNNCRGDSGGPMFAAVDYGRNNNNNNNIMRYVQFGIISGGQYTCGSSNNFPGVYTRVSSYISWILSSLMP